MCGSSNLNQLELDAEALENAHETSDEEEESYESDDNDEYARVHEDIADMGL